MTSQQNRLLIAGIVVAAAAAVLIYSLTRPAAEPAPIAVVEPSDQTPEATTTPAVRPRLTYQAAVAQYGDRRMQFNEDCEASPKQVTFKNNTAVMFDSRSTGPRTLTIDGRAYNLSGSGFVIVTLSSNTLPHTVQVDCGTGRNNAQIVLQR